MILFFIRYSKNGGTQDDTIFDLWGIEYFLLLENFFRLRVDDILYTFVLGKTNSFKKLNIQSKDLDFA